MQFRKYGSIENHHNGKLIDTIRLSGFDHPSIEWVVTEKIHGANFSFITDGDEIICCKRTSILSDEDKFHQFQDVRELLREKIYEVLRIVKMDYDVESCTIHGELFGGIYPHKEVKAVEGVHVQKGVYYSPRVEFYAFDLHVPGQSYVGYDYASSVFESAGLFYSKALFRGTFNEALEFDEAIQTTLPEMLGYPEIEDNIAEGIVIKPVEPKYDRNSRIMMKKKSERFKETMNPKRSKGTQKKKQEDISPELVEAVADLKRYVTENRLRNVLSKEGEIENTKEARGILIRLLARDALEEFESESPHAETLSEDDKKLLTKRLSGFAVKIVQKNFSQIVANDF